MIDAHYTHVSAVAALLFDDSEGFVIGAKERNWA